MSLKQLVFADDGGADLVGGKVGVEDLHGGRGQGRASAAALILVGIILVVTMINMQVSKKKVHY